MFAKKNWNQPGVPQCGYSFICTARDFIVKHLLSLTKTLFLLNLMADSYSTSLKTPRNINLVNETVLFFDEF